MRWVLCRGGAPSVEGDVDGAWRVTAQQGEVCLWEWPAIAGSRRVVLSRPWGILGFWGWLEDEAAFIARYAREGGGLEAALEALYLREGAAGLSACLGQCSVALWERATDQLWAFRDAMGLVPLWWADGAAGVRAVGTCAQRLGQRCGLAFAPNKRRLSCWLWRDVWDEGDDDFVRGISRVKPGHRIMLDARGGVALSPTWSPRLSPYVMEAAPEEVVLSGLEAALSEVVGPGAALCVSAGIDSGVLGALLKGRGAPMISMVSPGLPTCDESAELAVLEAAQGFTVERFDVTERWPGHDGALGAVDAVEDAWAGPALHVGAHEASLFAWAKDALGATVFVGGFGADELFMSVPALAMRRLWTTRPQDALRLSLSHAELRAPMGRQLIWALGQQVLGDRALEGYRAWRAGARLSAQAAAAAPWHDASRWVLGARPAGEVVTRLIHEPERWSLVKRRFILGWGWEFFVRTQWRQQLKADARIWSPYLDRRLWEAVLRWPPELLAGVGVASAHGWWDKVVLRRLFARLGAPDSLVWRRKVRSFDKLIERGLVVERGAAQLGPPVRLEALGLVDVAAFSAAFDAFERAVMRQYPEGAHVGSLALWQTLSAQAWLAALAR